MQLVPSARISGLALPASVAAVGVAVAGAFVPSALARPAVVTAGPAKTITAARISRPGHTLAPGSKVSAAKIFGHRVFTSGNDGFALVDTGSAQYPAATTNGGKTWKTDGPALHENAAQAPLAVVDIGAANRKTVFAWGTGQVIDATSNGGKTWYRASFSGLPVAVLANPQGHLVAFIDGSGSASSGPTLQYVSKNGGRTWRFDTTVGGS